MITLEQIQVLDKKIKDAIELINRLREEKNTLKAQVASYEETIARLEGELSSYQSDSDKIEEGFIDVLSRLEQVDEEDTSAPVQQEQEEIILEPHTGEEDVLIEEEIPEEEEEDDESDETIFMDEEEAEDDEPALEETFAADEMQFEAAAEETADQPASEEPDIDEGIPLVSDEEESQVNHSEQQEENEDSRSPQDLDIF